MIIKEYYSLTNVDSERKNVFVGCSSRGTKSLFYLNAAHSIGKFIANSGHNLVFGGCNSGLMGLVYRLVSASPSSKVIVTMTEAYKDDLQGIRYDELYLSDTVNERKNVAFACSDALVFLPGGIGTIDEFMSAVEASRANQFTGPIIVINSDGFFDSLIIQLKKATSEGFIDRLPRNCFFVPTAQAGINYLKGFGF